MKSLESFILSSSNSWSNYSFVFFGSLCIYLGVLDMQSKSVQNNHVRKTPQWMILHGLFLIFGGLGSFAFHASYLKMAHKLDIASIYTFMCPPVLYAILNLFLSELNRNSKQYGDTISKIAVVVSFPFIFWFGFWVIAKVPKKDHGQVLWIQAAIITGCVVLKYIKERCVYGRKAYYINVWLLILAFISILLAAALQEKILVKFIQIECDPKSIWQPHSGWHLFASFSIFLSMLIFWTEHEQNDQDLKLQAKLDLKVKMIELNKHLPIIDKKESDHIIPPKNEKPADIEQNEKSYIIASETDQFITTKIDKKEIDLNCIELPDIKIQDEQKDLKLEIEEMDDTVEIQKNGNDENFSMASEVQEQISKPQ